MRSHVTFTTRRLNQTEVHPHFINGCCFGEDSIAWLVAISWHCEDALRRGGSPGASAPDAPPGAGSPSASAPFTR